MVGLFQIACKQIYQATMAIKPIKTEPRINVPVRMPNTIARMVIEMSLMINAGDNLNLKTCNA